MAHVKLRNTVSGVVAEFPEKTARRLLKNPSYAGILVEVEKAKNEVLSKPYKVEGEKRVPIEDKKEGDK